MCDTLYASGRFTRDGVPIFGKNSDRYPNEAHVIVTVPAEDHLRGKAVQCTYVQIPQVEHTFAVLLAKPFWIWGAEMGANEHGVVIGNEAVFSKIPAGNEPGLIGMDFLRLGLERAATSRQAINVITELLEKYGQSGNCGFQHAFYYHNSYLIADPQEAWVLETADRHWVARRIQDIYTISNRYSIGKEWDLASKDLVTHAMEQRWCHGQADFHFSRCYSDKIYSHFSYGEERSCRTRSLLEAKQGALTVSDAMAILRDHGENKEASWSPGRGILGATVCMHAGFGPIRGSQTTGSMVSHLRKQQLTHFFTGTAAPCTSVFKPVWLDAGVPDTGPAPQGEYDGESLWWQHERIHRETLQNYPALIRRYQEDRDELEGRFITKSFDLAGCSHEARSVFSNACFKEALIIEKKWLEGIHSGVVERNIPWYTKMAWEKHNRAAKLNLSSVQKGQS